VAPFERVRFSAVNPLIVFGRVLFFSFSSRGSGSPNRHRSRRAALRQREFLAPSSAALGGPSELFPASYGFSLPGVYFIWFTAIVIAYPVCRRYAEFKQCRRDLWWLRYL
jgi:hypothetical protein